MKCASPTETATPETPATRGIRLPTGLLGFEQIKEYALIANPGEEPFQWLEVKGNPSLAFVVVEPFRVVPDYRPDLPQTDVEFLGISSPDDVQLFNIVTVHGPSRATVNLKGPIVVNRHTGVGKQVVIANAVAYSVQHPLPLAAAEQP
jgi:flagellar assembly factor FliW